jgi:hypothetical protein
MAKEIEIKEWRDFTQFGINMLTAEADGTGLRLLCDVSQAGVDLLSEFYGVKTMEVYEARNTGDKINGLPPIGSLFLTRGIFLDLAAFCVLHVADVAVVVQPQKGEYWTVWESVTGYSKEEFEHFRTRDQLYQWRAVYKGGDARGGFRNIHHWSGRIE